MFFTPVVVNILNGKVNTVDNGSFINVGSTVSIDKFISYKRNQAFGEQNGDLSPINIPVSYVVDPDVTDNPTVKTSVI